MAETAAIIGGVASLASGIMGANAAKKEARARRAAGKYQAMLLEKEAFRQIEVNKEDMRMFRFQAAKAEGENIANIGASGTTATGSNSDILMANFTAMKRDEEILTRQGAQQVERLMDEAKLARMGASAAGAAGSTGAAASLLSGVAQTASYFVK